MADKEEAILLPTPAPEISDEEMAMGEEFIDPLGETGDPLAIDHDQEVPLDGNTAQQVADIYTMASMRPVSVSQVMARATSTGDVTGGDIANLLNEIGQEDDGVQKDMIVKAISNPRVGVEQRIELAKIINGDSGFDLNVITRQAMHNANVMENGGETEDDLDAVEAGAQAAESVPKNITVDTPVPTPLEEAREFYTGALNEAYKGASETGLFSKDFAASALPFRYEIPVMRIFDAYGLDRGAVNTATGVLLGDALRMMREHVEKLDDKGKKEALDTALRILKPNSGVFQDGNDFVTAHTLEQVFYRDLYGTSPETANASEQVDRLSGELALLKKGGASEAAIASKEKLLQRAKDEASGKVRASPTGMTVMDNFGSLMDLAGLGSLAKSTIRLGTKWLPKSLFGLRKVAPDMATKTAIDALDNEAIRLKFPNLQPEDVVAASLPSSTKALQEGGVNGMGELIARQLDIRERMLRIADRSNMAAAERADAFSEIQKIYGDVAAQPTSTLHINESVFTAGPTSAKIEAIFGRTKSKPFASLNGARKASIAEIEKTFGTDARLEIVWRNPKTGALESVPEGMSGTKKGEFFLRAVDERAYESAPTVFHSLTMGDKAVSNLRFAPSLWKWLRGPTILSKDVADNLRLASRQRTEWNKLTAGLTVDIAKLSGRDSRMLAKVLKDGEEVSAVTGKGKTYTPSELRSMGMSQDGQRAYYAYRNATDIMYEVVNKQTRTRMLREGMKDIHGPKGRVGFAQPRTFADASADINERAKALHLYDPVKGTFVQMDRQALDNLYKAGGSVAKLEQPMLGKGAAEASHVLLEPTSKAKVLGLPRNVVTKVEGYYPHMWNGNYIVYGMTKAGNRFALGLASNEADAKAVVARMKAVNARRSAAGKANRFDDISYDFDRQLSQDLGRRGGVQEGLYTNMGGPVYGHRNGGSLRNYSKAAGDVQVDPIESMLRGMEIVGSKVTKGDLATHMRQKVYQYAKAEGILKDWRIVPTSADDLVKTAAKSAQYERAKAYLESIDNMLNMDDAVDQAMSKFFMTASTLMSDYLGKTGWGKALASKLASKAAKGSDPMSSLMGLMHRTTIATSPLGQGALQASQSLMMLGVSPINYIKAVRQTGVVSMLIGMRTSALHGGKAFALNEADFMREAKTVALAAGMQPDEVVKVVDTILDSGLVSAVGYHTQMRNAIRSAAEERMMARAKGLNKPMGGVLGRAARSVDAATFGTLSKVGFETGEQINQIATFLTLYNRDKAKGIANLADPDYVRSLVGSVSELTGDMIPETGFSYQRGWLKAAMQFVSFQHKMLLLTLPKALGGAQSLTGAEKAGMVFGQFLLFGRRGAPHIDAFYRLVDNKIRDEAGDDAEGSQMYQAWNHPATKAVMDGLLFDTTGNAVLKELFGNEDTPEFALAERFAPGGGSEFMMDRLFALASNPTKALFGLAGEKASKLYKFFKRVGDVTMANIRDHDDVPLDERFEELAKEGGINLMSQYNRYLAMKTAERMDGWLSSGGAVTEGYSGALEGQLYTQFGIMTKDRESLYEAMDKYNEERLTNPLAKQRDLDELAQQYYKQMIMTGVRLNGEATEDATWNTMMDKWVREQGLLFSVLPEEDAEYISSAVAERLQKAVAGQADSAELVFIERLSKDINAGKFGAEGPDVALYLEEADFVKNNPRLFEMVRQAYVNATTDDYLENK